MYALTPTSVMFPVFPAVGLLVSVTNVWEVEVSAALITILQEDLSLFFACRYSTPVNALSQDTL